MKIIKSIITCCVLLLTTTFTQAQVGIGTTTPNISAQLDVSSNNKGFLPPRMRAGQRDSISSPAAGLVIWCNNCGTNGELQVFNGNTWTNATGGAVSFGCGAKVSFTYAGGSVTYGSVLNPVTNKCWLDRNLGATRAATSSTDDNAYGDLFQWGRSTDGHQLRSNSFTNTTSTQSSTDNPGHGFFIAFGGPPLDWRNPKNDNLWQGVSGINNPCPSGWRVPSEAEFTDEINSWSTQNSVGAFASPLKLTVAGYRNSINATIDNAGTSGPSSPTGAIWSTTVIGNNAKFLEFTPSSTTILQTVRSYGHSIRCIKN